MGNLEEKYPLLLLDDESMSPEDVRDRQQELWQRQAALRKAAKECVNHVDLFLGSRLHDSAVLSVKLENESLSICVNDLIFQTCFFAVNGLLGLDVPEDLIQSRVIITLNGLRNVSAYKSSGFGANPYSPIPIEDALPIIKEYLYDEIASVTPQGISIGFELFAKSNEILILDVDAQGLRIEENLRSDFIALFGEHNLDLFDAFWIARVEQKIGWDCFDTSIGIVRSLRPDVPENCDLKNNFVRRALIMEAEREENTDNYDRAADIYRELIQAKYENSLCMKLGMCLCCSGQYNEALLYLHAAAGAYPKIVYIRYHLVLAWYGLERLNDAADALEYCLQIHPKFGPALKFIEEHENIREYLDLEQEL